jgi:hypothetical protein
VSDDAAAVRAEWRAEEEAWARAALERWEHGRGLDDVLRDSMQRGDRVVFTFPTVAWTGAIVAVGSDVARVDAGDVPVDVPLAAAAPFVLRVQSGRSGLSGRSGHSRGPRVTDPLTTFRARLRELDGTRVCIGTPSGPLEGSVRVGRDQLRLVDREGAVAYVPADSVWWVRPVLDD